ncbi:MAG: hypothetical protein NTV87_16915 [Ignavibacteriae bacterium]|nr:hypothetical protein [Ignavibacteriota bacterium]
MKTKLVIRTTGLLFLLVSLFILYSCSKTAKESLTEEQKQLADKNLEASSIDEKDFTESDADLTSVDYKEFYDQLTAHGEWVQVTPEEIGLQSKTAMNEGAGNNDFSLSNLLGIKEGYASGVNVGLVYAWKPSADLGVTLVAGETPVYVPYSNGQWVNTDAGWYFKAPTPVEETVSHYGRWVNSPTAGWMWLPGRVWAPAWVDWRQNDRYVSWAPLPPSVYLNNGVMSIPVIDNSNYMIVNRQYFLEPSVYTYNNVYYDDGSRILVSGFTGTDGIVIVNNSIFNRGPDVNIIQQIYGRPVELVKIQHVRNFNDVRYSGSEYYVYAPGFKKYKSKNNKIFTINEPKSYKKYNEWKVKEFIKEEKEIRKEIKKEEKEIRKEIKSNGNGKKKYIDDSNMKNKGNENVKKNNSNNNGKKNNGSDNVKKNNDIGKKKISNDNGNKKNGKDNGNKQNGNDNGNKQTGKDNGNKQNSNDNGNKQNGKNNGNGKK